MRKKIKTPKNFIEIKNKEDLQKIDGGWSYSDIKTYINDLVKKDKNND